jgi:hypothetical protein
MKGLDRSNPPLSATQCSVFRVSRRIDRYPRVCPIFARRVVSGPSQLAFSLLGAAHFKASGKLSVELLACRSTIQHAPRRESRVGFVVEPDVPFAVGISNWPECQAALEWFELRPSWQAFRLCPGGSLHDKRPGHERYMLMSQDSWWFSPPYGRHLAIGVINSSDRVRVGGDSARPPRAALRRP